MFGRRSVAMAWSAHTLLLLAAIGIVLVCVGVLSWLAFRKSELVGECEQQGPVESPNISPVPLLPDT